jgi:hypothetical protein
MTTLRRRTPLTLLALALCACASAAEYQGRGPVVTPAQAAATGARLPSIPSGARNLSVPSLNAGVSLPSLPGAPSAAIPSAPQGPSAAAAILPSAPAALPAAAVPAAPAAHASLSSKTPGAPNEASGKASIETRLGQTQKELAPELKDAAEGKGDARLTGEEIQRVLSGDEGRRGAPAAAPVPSYMGLPSALAHRLPNPAALFPQARALAVEAAKKWGVPADKVAFGEVTASMPAGPDGAMHFGFYAIVGEGKVKPILVTFTPSSLYSPASRHAAFTRTWDTELTLDRKLFPELSTDYLFKRGSEASPDTALDEARRSLPSLGAGVSFALRFEEQPETGAVDLWYRFFDDAGSEVAVNSRTGERVVAHDAAVRKTVDHVMGEGTVNVLGAAAAGAAVYPLGLAVSHLTGHFFIVGFIFAYLAVLTLGMVVKLVPHPKARRWGTVIGTGAIFSPLLAVAYVGLKAAVVGLGVLGAAAGTVKDKAPAEKPTLVAGYAQASQAAQDAARRYTLPAPKFAEARLTENGWVYDFEAGDRLIIAQDNGRGGMSAYAYGAREKSPLFPRAVALELAPSSFALGAKVSPEEGRRLAAARLGNTVSDVALSVIVLEQEFSGDKDLWYVADDTDGRRAAVNARTGAVKDMFTGPSRAEVEAAARGAASYKGMPWSHTEYSMTLAGYESGLRKAGATFAQLQLFHKLADAAPIKGGRFNPWSGD